MPKLYPGSNVPNREKQSPKLRPCTLKRSVPIELSHSESLLAGRVQSRSRSNLSKLDTFDFAANFLTVEPSSANTLTRDTLRLAESRDPFSPGSRDPFCQAEGRCASIRRSSRTTCGV